MTEVSEVLAGLLGASPGLGVLAGLLALDQSTLDPVQAVTALQVLERTLAWLTAFQADLLVQAAGIERFTDLYRFDLPADYQLQGSEAIADADWTSVKIQDAVREEIAAALGWGPWVTQKRIETARLLAGPLHATATALATGAITPAHVQLIGDRVGRLPDAWTVTEPENWHPLPSTPPNTHPGTDTSTDTDQDTSTDTDTDQETGQGPGRDHDLISSQERSRARFLAQCAAIEHQILPYASSHGITRTRRRLDKTIACHLAQHDPRIPPHHPPHASDTSATDSTAEAVLDPGSDYHAWLLAQQDVYITDDPGGLSTLTAHLTTINAHACMAAINTHTTATKPDTFIPIDQRRAHSLIALLCNPTNTPNTPSTTRTPSTPSTSSTMSTPSTPSTSDSGSGDAGTSASRPRIRAHLDILVDLPTVLGLANNPGEITPGITISAHQIRDLLTNLDNDLTMRRLICDPQTGHLLDYGRRVYQVPDRLRDYLRARDRTCRFPECNRRADLCHIDHATPWNTGGETNRANLGALCTRHHQLKTHGGWHLTTPPKEPPNPSHPKPPPTPDQTGKHDQPDQPDGTCTWTSPQGRTYHHTPEPLLPPTIPAPPHAPNTHAPDVRNPSQPKPLKKAIPLDPDPPPF